MEFLALDFVFDQNIAGNLYWYINTVADIRVGDEVLARIGKNDKVQCARVRRIERADDGEIPDFLRRRNLVSPEGAILCRKILARKNSRRIPLKNTVCTKDLGGFYYDHKHLTQYGVFLRSDLPTMNSFESDEMLRRYRVKFIADLRAETDGVTPWYDVEGIETVRLPVCDGLESTSDEAFVLLFRLLAEADGCVVIADETGYKSALVAYTLCAVAGVSDADFLRDYALSFARECPREELSRKIAALCADAEKLYQGRDAVGFLRSVGVSAEEIQKIRFKLTHETGEEL